MTAQQIKSKLRDNKTSLMLGIVGIGLTIFGFLFGGWISTEKSNAATDEWKKSVEYKFDETKIELNKKVSVESFRSVIENNNTAHSKIESTQKEMNDKLSEYNSLLHEIKGELKNKK